MKLIIQDESIVYSRQDKVHTVDVGRKNKNSLVSVRIVVQDENISDFELSPKCGCTATLAEQINENEVEIEIKYKDSHKLGGFNKTSTVKYKTNGKTVENIIKIKGVII